MALTVIGAGFGRTGTTSMKAALERIGFGPCHHMQEVNRDPAQKEIWRAIAAGEEPNWERALEGYRSALDWPSSHYWRELSTAYPGAKLILTLRDPGEWYASMDRTILRSLRKVAPDDASVGARLIRDQVFGGQIDDRAHVIEVYERNTVAVQEAFRGSESRLLTYHLGDGWDPLCAFLGVPVPDAPYPHRNTSSDFNRS